MSEKRKESEKEKENEKSESVGEIESLGKQEIQIEKEDREKEEEERICVQQSDEKVVFYSNQSNEAYFITNDLNLSFSSLALSQKIEDEFPKEVLIGLQSIQIEDLQFESIFNRPKEFMENMCCFPCYLQHNGKDSKTNFLEERGNDEIRQRNQFVFDEGTTKEC